MPWTRLRVERASEKDLRRRSDVESSQRPIPLAPINYGSQIQTMRSAEPQRRIRDSVVSLSAMKDPPVFDEAESTPIQERPPKHHRFSMLRFRHASDSQLSRTAKEQADSVTPPMPSLSTPAIITTAPTQENLEVPRRKQVFTLPRRLKTPNARRSFALEGSQTSFGRPDNNFRDSEPQQVPRLTVDEPGKLRATAAPPAYGDESSSALALPVARLSESSRSDGSSGDHGVFATTTTTHTVSTTTTFFRLPRRKNNKTPLFPLPPKVVSAQPSPSSTPRLSTGGRPSESPVRQSFSAAVDSSEMNLFTNRKNGHSTPAHATLVATSTTFAAPGSSLLRTGSSASHHSQKSTTTDGRPSGLGKRGRSSTMSSLRRAIEDDPLPTPPLPQSTRTSTSTAGRASLGGLFNLSRLRQSSEPVFGRSGLHNSGTPGTPNSINSKQNSISLSREPPLVIPERQEGDTPAKYLARLEEVVNRGALVALLSKSEDEFSKHVLRSYMRRFKFFEDPLDMAIRKMLMHVELPKETQHIDRTVQSFADRYHECNPGIFASSDDAYFIAFSILILHTDVFNKNNKHKMQKNDYTKNTQGRGVAQEILEYYYDNITYTPFIHVEDDLDITGERIVASKPRKSAFKAGGSGALRKNGTGPVDPYTLIFDANLDTLRPPLDDILVIQDPFSYLGSGVSMNLSDLHRTFFKSGVIQILSSRSRPEAFMNQATITNPLQGQVGVVSMKVTKVGILWRKDPKKKKARSPWQDWGAILTGSQLYFFRNTSWVKSLMSQHENHHKQGRSNTAVVFKPPLEHFKPDFLLSTEDVVALVDSQYKKHKHAFVFTRQNVFQEVLLADSDTEMNDWLAKLNYAAAFRTAGVRMRGVVGGHYEGTGSVESQSQDSSSSSHAVHGPKGEVSIKNGRLNSELAQEVMLARRQILGQKIAEADEKLTIIEKQLEALNRNARHLEILAPIQQKTREGVVDAAFKLATNIRWARAEFWRVKCHRDILSLDLEEDVRLSIGGESQSEEQRQHVTLTSPSSAQPQSKSAFGRLNSKSSNTPSTSRPARPLAQPTGTKIFSADLFKSPTRILSQHRAQTSWELPPLTFDGKDSTSAGKHTSIISQPMPVETSNTSSDASRVGGKTEVEKIAAEIAAPAERENRAEHDLLVEAGLFSPESMRSETNIAQEFASDEDKAKALDADGNDGLSKVRHSFHRKLQSTHVPHHHRSKKGKDSSSSTALTDDSSFVADNEGLPRVAGSFRVHGKKASVINFGSEWQSMSPEERLNLRKHAHMEESKLSMPLGSEDDAFLTAEGLYQEVRPSSARSISTTTTKSLGYLSVAESKPSDSLGSVPAKHQVES